MSVTLNDYLGRITPWQSIHPRFEASVRATLAPIVNTAAVVATLPAAFDLDTAIGVQLDATGAWVGRDRYVRIPIPHAWFSFDIEGLGYDQAVWQNAYSGEIAIFALDDETYRRLLYANIVAKHWDGTVPGAQAAFDTYFIDPDTHVFVQDNTQASYPLGGQASTTKVDVSMTIGVSGKIPPTIDLGLLAQDGIPIKPAGVQTDYAVTSVDGTPLFGFDVQNEFISGFDTGAFGVDPATLLVV